MPSKSKAQHNLMAAVANNPKFAKKAGIPQTVGEDYMKADKKVKKYNMGGMAMSAGKGYKEGGSVKDACYRKVKSRYKVFPSAYASGAIAKCRKVGAKNWGNK